MDSSRDWDRRYDHHWLVCLGDYETLAVFCAHGARYDQAASFTGCRCYSAEGIVMLLYGSVSYTSS